MSARAAQATRASAVRGDAPGGTTRFRHASGHASGHARGLAQRPVGTPFGQSLQAKLAVGPAGDRYEREADWAARQVLGASPVAPSLTPLATGPFGGPLAQRVCGACLGRDEDKPLIQRKSACGGTGGADCRCGCGGAMEQDETMEQPGGFPVARRAAGPAAPVSGAIERVTDTIARPGRPLQRALRQDMERRFDRSFRDVRLHDDAEAAASAAAVNAHAYTVGNHIVFGRGRFQPGASAGRMLIAHELAHTLQQSGAGASTPDRISRPSDPHEQQADRAAGLAMGSAFGPTTAPAMGLAAPGSPAAGLTTAPTQVSRYGLEDLERDAAAVGNAIDSGIDSATDAIGEAIDDVGDALGGALTFARDIAAAIGGAVSVSGGKVVISVPSFSPCPEIDFQGTLGDLGLVPSIDVPLVMGVLPVTGILNLYGAFGVGAALNPGIGIRLARCDLGPFKITIDPLGLAASAAGAVSVDAALSYEAQLDLSAFGEVGALLIIPDPPLVIQIPVLGIRAGGTGQVRLTVGGSLSENFSVSLSTAGVSQAVALSGDLGLQGDIGLGLFASIEVLGQNLCRFNFPLYEAHADTAVSFDLGLALSLSRSGISAAIAFRGATTTDDPLADIGTDFDRSVLEDDCILCDILASIHAFPSQIHGPWPYHPTPALGGPAEVFPRNAGLASRALCRGACGIDCPDQCTDERDEIRCVNPTEEGGAHTLYVYEGYQECGSHQGCRDHDACYDWSAAAGEVGTFWLLVGPLHRLCDLECLCDYGAGSCIPWAVGGGDQPDTMAFAERLTVRKGCLGPCPEEVESEDGGTGYAPIRLQDIRFFDQQNFTPEPYTQRFGPYVVWGPHPVPISGTPVDAALLALVRAQGGARVGISGYIGPLTLRGANLVLDPAGLVYGGSARLALGLGAQGSLSLSGALNGALTLACAVELGSLTGELMVTGTLRLPSELGAEATVRCHDGILYLDTGVDFRTTVAASVRLSAQVSGRALGFDIFSFPWHSEDFQLFRRTFELGIDFAPVALGQPAEFVVDERLIRLANMLIDLFGIAAAEEPEHEPNDEPDFIAEFDILDPCGWFGGDDDDDGPPASDCVEVKATAMLADAERILGSDDPRLTNPFWSGGTTLSNDCGSATAGTFMEAEFLTTRMTGGSRARGQDAIYRRGGFPTHASRGSCFSSTPVPGTMFFIRGHLLNGDLGGPGNQNTNLFPITHNANADHSNNVENGGLDVKGNVRSGKVMYYEVEVRHDSPERIVSDGTPQEFFQIDSSFRCEVAEYRVCEGDWLERKPSRTHTVLSTFIDQGGARSFNNIANPAGCPCRS
jgi:hypothetical protein